MFRLHPTLARSFAQVVQQVRGWDYRADLEELESLERADPEVLHEYRMARLRLLLEHCQQRVPFYREAIRSSGLVPNDVRNVEDLATLPIVDKDLLRTDYSRFHADPNDRKFDVWESSGSTGEPFAFRRDRRGITCNSFAALARGRRWWGIDAGARELMIWSGARDVSGTLMGRYRALGRQVSWRLKNILLIDIYDLDKDRVLKAYQSVLRFRPESTRSISSGLYRFSSLLEELGLDGRALGIRNAIFTGEAFPDAQRRAVERILGCKTISEYGCTELGIIAFECPDGGNHLAHENLICEFLKDGKPAAAGEEAELVVTNLNDFVSPLIRYAVGDIVVPSSRLCSCGRTSPLIERIGGRSHAAIRTPGGALVHGLFFTHLFDGLPVVHRFRVIQKSLHDLRLELTSSESIPTGVMERVETAVRKVAGDTVRVEVVQVADLSLARSGKFRWIVSELDDSSAEDST